MEYGRREPYDREHERDRDNIFNIYFTLGAIILNKRKIILKKRENAN